MGAICLIDTSIFLEILNVPHKASQSELIFQELKEKIEAGESLFLPMATILETGNHIAQNGNGDQRRICAGKFVNRVTQALEGESPFTPINFLKQEDLQGWLKEFPDEAMQGRGLGDLSIIHDWQKICDQHPSRRVYIWSLDKHLKGYNRPPKL
ncbi:hypothetical protein [Microcystis aeruginosa]|jgi:hypothetical protein|uniref:hypothetical protein n=1 Tax=Microcystis aeruginosa TaxID=1126 RepID=UPI002931087F|nr:hypothetical protein [Microcystis aeruginosa]WOB69966.1 hypothetical protein PJW00_08075 [Microcystis aeruginosa LE3]